MVEKFLSLIPGQVINMLVSTSYNLEKYLDPVVIQPRSDIAL